MPPFPWSFGQGPSLPSGWIRSHSATRRAGQHPLTHVDSRDAGPLRIVGHILGGAAHDFYDVARPHPRPQVRAPALKGRLLSDPPHRVVDRRDAVVAGPGRGRLPAHIPGVTAITLPVRIFVRPGVDLAFQVAAHALVLFAADLAARVALF